MPSCSARGCSNRKGRDLNVTYHIFPKGNEARQQWIPVTGRKNWVPGKRAVLCSDHFEEACMDRTGQTTRIRDGAIPTIGKFAPKMGKIPGKVCAQATCKMIETKENRKIGLTFHKFPKDVERRKRWSSLMQRGRSWQAKDWHVVCSKHFTAKDFDRTGQTVRLREDVEPSVFDAPDYLQKKRICIKEEPRDEGEVKQSQNKNGIRTRSGRQLSGRMALTLAAMKKDPSENEEMEEANDPDNLGVLDPADDPSIGPAASTYPDQDDPSIDPAASTYPDHFYCRTESEMASLLKKSEQKVEFLRMKLKYLKSPKETAKEEAPAWSQFRRATLEKEAELIRASLKAGSSVLGHTHTENLLVKDEQLRNKLKEAEDLRKQIKSLNQRNRRLKKKSKAKFIRYVVMIEPAKKGKKAKATCMRDDDDNDDNDDEEDDDDGEEQEQNIQLKEEEMLPKVEQVSSIQESILSHTASMIVGANNVDKEKDKQIKDLKKKLKIAKLKEKRKTEQLEHFQEVVEILKEKCPEYSTQKDPITQRQCPACHSPVLTRCHEIPEAWSSNSDSTQDLALPPLRPKRDSSRNLKSSLWSLYIGRVSLCSNCQASVCRRRSRIGLRRSPLSRLRPLC